MLWAVYAACTGKHRGISDDPRSDRSGAIPVSLAWCYMQNAGIPGVVPYYKAFRKGALNRNGASVCHEHCTTFFTSDQEFPYGPRGSAGRKRASDH